MSAKTKRLTFGDLGLEEAIRKYLDQNPDAMNQFDRLKITMDLFYDKTGLRCVAYADVSERGHGDYARSQVEITDEDWAIILDPAIYKPACKHEHNLEEVLNEFSQVKTNGNTGWCMNQLQSKINHFFRERGLPYLYVTFSRDQSVRNRMRIAKLF